jgi:hypothetical protein
MANRFIYFLIYNMLFFYNNLRIYDSNFFKINSNFFALIFYLTFKLCPYSVFKFISIFRVSFLKMILKQSKFHCSNNLIVKF